MKVSFKVTDNFSSEFVSDDIKLSIEIVDGNATITAVKEEVDVGGEKWKGAAKEKCEKKPISPINWQKQGVLAEPKCEVNEALSVQQHDPVIVETEKEITTSETPVVTECKFLKPESAISEKIKKVFDSESAIPSKYINRLGEMLEQSKPFMDRFEANEEEKTKRIDNFNKENKESAEQYNHVKAVCASGRKRDDRVAFTHFLHCLIDIPAAFKKYKDQEGQLLMLGEEGNKIYFYDRTEDKFQYLDNLNKKIYEVPDDVIKQKWAERTQILKEFDEVEAKKKEVSQEVFKNKVSKSSRSWNKIMEVIKECENEKKKEDENKIKVISNFDGLKEQEKYDISSFKLPNEVINTINESSDNKDKKEKTDKDEDKI